MVMGRCDRRQRGHSSLSCQSAGEIGHWPCRRRRPLHNRHSRERRPLHNRHCRTSPTVIPAKAGIQGGASGWRGLLHFHDLALHGELCKGLRKRESRVGPQAGGSCFTFTTSPPRGVMQRSPKAGIQGGAPGWRELLHFHDLALHGELCKGLRKRESRVGPQAGGSCFTFTTSPSTGSYAKVSRRPRGGGCRGWTLSGCDLVAQEEVGGGRTSWSGRRDDGGLPVLRRAGRLHAQATTRSARTATMGAWTPS